MKTPEFYRTNGFEDIGYAPPALSSKDTYPDYIRHEVLECVRRIQEHQSASTLTFAFMTDLHYAMNENHEIRMKRTMNAYKEIVKRVHIDKLVLGGDYTNEGCKAYKSDCYRELRAQLAGIAYYPVNGNHDDGTIWDKQYLKAEQSVNHLTHEELYTLFYNHLPSLGVHFDRKARGLYYYCDNAYCKMRYVFLDSGDIPYLYDEKGKLLYDGQHLFAISQRQYEWLTEEALMFREEGWSVMFFLHSTVRPSLTPEALAAVKESEYRNHMYLLNELINCYKSGVKCNLRCEQKDFEVSIQADFSQRIRGDVIGVFLGDYHADLVERGKSGVPFILTANCVTYWGKYSPMYVMRYDGDKTELLFDVVTVNPEERKIYITRVGAGSDRVVDY